MLKSLSIFFLVLLVLAKSLLVPIAILDYEANKGFIAKNLCENKAKPKMQCNGKCHLRKQLSKTSESSKKGEESRLKLSVETPISLGQTRLPAICCSVFYLGLFTQSFDASVCWLVAPPSPPPDRVFMFA